MVFAGLSQLLQSHQTRLSGFYPSRLATAFPAATRSSRSPDCSGRVPNSSLSGAQAHLATVAEATFCPGSASSKIFFLLTEAVFSWAANIHRIKPLRWLVTQISLTAATTGTMPNLNDLSDYAELSS